MERFNEKTILVTGAASGIGLASVENFLAAGAQVIAMDVSQEGIRSLGERFANDALLELVVDVSDEDQFVSALDAAEQKYDRIDHYHLNAGVFGTTDPITEVTLGDFRSVMDINVSAVFLGIREALNRYKRLGHRGNIVITGSIAGIRAGADLTAYHTSKHAVNGLMKSAAMFAAPLGIRINSVAPGIVPTRLFAEGSDSSSAIADMISRAKTSPMRRAGDPEEIAQVVAFLLGEHSTYVTGQSVSADGGASVSSSVRPSGGAGAWDAAKNDNIFYAGWGLSDGLN